MIRPILLGSLLLATCASTARAAFVNPNAMVYQAGGNITGSTAPDPVLFTLPGGANVGVSFAVGGTTDCYDAGDTCVPWGADGNLGDDVVLLTTNRLSGVSYRGFYSLPLLGVFLGPTLPAAAPQGSGFQHAEDFVHLFPQLGQVFWIGDGLTGTGAGRSQVFHVPADATRLYVGFFDPVPNDNSGGLNVVPSFATVTETPGKPSRAGEVSLTASPNPTPGAMQLRFELALSASVDLIVSDVAGRTVRTIARGEYAAGAHELAWDGRDGEGRAAKPGVYFAVLRVDGSAAAKASIVRMR